MAKKFTQAFTDQSDCPCQSDLSYGQCCGRFLKAADKNDTSVPQTAEQLMRSRYTAYVLSNSLYLLNTWHPQYRPQKIDLSASDQQWIGLKIKETHKGQAQDDSGEVHFIARYKVNGEASHLEERSQFVKMAGQWFYTTGQIL